MAAASTGRDLLARVTTRLCPLPGEQRLLLAVLGLACRDARSGNGHAASARAFLDGEGFAIYSEALGVRPERLRWWLRRAGELPNTTGS